MAFYYCIFEISIFQLCNIRYLEIVGTLYLNHFYIYVTDTNLSLLDILDMICQVHYFLHSRCVVEFNTFIFISRYAKFDTLTFMSRYAKTAIYFHIYVIMTNSITFSFLSRYSKFITFTRICNIMVHSVLYIYVSLYQIHYFTFELCSGVKYDYHFAYLYATVILLFIVNLT